MTRTRGGHTIPRSKAMKDFEPDDAGDPGDDTPWLRDMVEEDMLGLFSEDEETVRDTVRKLVKDGREDPGVEARLIDLVETSLDEKNDDSSASSMAVVILGELRSERALGVLRRTLALDEDEDLQDAASVALLRLGAPAFLSLMEAVEEEDNPMLNRAAYGVLGGAGALDDERLRASIMDFLEARVETERRKGPGESALDELFRTSSQLGDRRQIPVMKRVLREDFRGRHAGIQDSIEALEENREGVAFVTTVPPWLERYGWLFEDEREASRVNRPPRGGSRPDRAGEDGERGAEEDDKSEVARLLWGLSATVDGEGEDALDARDYLARPGDREDRGEPDAAGEDE
jgi:hypothetical protein